MKTVADLLAGQYRLIEVDHEQTVLAAARRMAEENISALLVTRGGKVVGIVTERDVLRRVVAEQRDPGSVKAGEIMTIPVLSVDLETPLDECGNVMSREGLRHLLVRDGSRALAVVSVRDLLHAKAQEQQGHIQRLEEHLYQYS